MSKFVKTLVIINGLLLPIILCFFLFKISEEFFKEKRPYYTEEGMLVGEELSQAKKNNLALQGIHYDEPQTIYNSSNYYLPVSVMTYEEARDLKSAISSAGDIGYNLSQIMNVIFLDSNYNVIGTLLNRKASIEDMEVRGRRYYDDKDSLIEKKFKHLIFKIGFKDTNKDGKLNKKDNHDLYISDLKGSHLLQISNNVDIISFEYVHEFSQINIVYQDRTNEKSEHKRNRFAHFDIDSKTWLEYDDLNQKLNDLEVQLIN